MTTGIYQITNNINGMFYIGQSVDIDKRWIHHNCKGSQCVKIRNALRKYGRENFTLTILEELERERLTEREQFYLDALDPFGPRGYNICRVAGCGPSQKGVAKTGRCKKGPDNKGNVPVACFTEDGILVAEYYNVISAAEAHNIDRMGIFNCLAGRSRVAAGLFWARKGETPVIREKHTRLGMKTPPETREKISNAARRRETNNGGLNAFSVYGVHTDTGERVDFLSGKEAAAAVGCSPAAISRALRTGYTVKSHKWYRS